MLSRGTALAQQTLWCKEHLPESPSSTSIWAYNESQSAVDCAVSNYCNQSRNALRKQPLAELPNSACLDLIFGHQVYATQTEDIYFYKKPPIDQTLNTPQRLYVPVDLDKTIHWDNRTLTSLLEAERHNFHLYKDSKRLFAVQSDINYDSYRCETVRWMLDICTEENCDLSIFPLAVAYLDRILMTIRVPTDNLQALASACLLLASKMNAPQPLTSNRIADYSDGFVSVNNVLEWEIAVVDMLKWEISLHTIFEFFDQLMVRAPSLETFRAAFFTIAYDIQLDQKLSCLLPSVQCALAVCLLMLNSNDWVFYRKLVKCYFGVDFADFKNHLFRLRPNLTEEDLKFWVTNNTVQRPPIYQIANPFVPLV